MRRSKIGPIGEGQPAAELESTGGHFFQGPGDGENEDGCGLANGWQSFSIVDRTVRLEDCNLNSRNIELLVATEGFDQVVTLALGGNRLGVKGCALIGGADIASVRELDLEDCKPGLGKDEVAALVRGGNWSQLHTLNLDSNSLGAAGCEQLAKGSWSSLRHLSLDANGIGPGGCVALASSTALDQVRHLSLNGNVLGGSGIGSLCTGTWGRLEKLCVDGCGIDPAGCVALAGRSWARLGWLEMNHNPVGASGCRALALGTWGLGSGAEAGAGPTVSESPAANCFPALEALLLNRVGVETEGLDALAMGKWPRLRRLFLSSNRIADISGLTKLEAPLLDELHLGYNEIHDLSPVTLWRAPPALTTLALMDNPWYEAVGGEAKALRVLTLHLPALTSAGQYSN